MEWGAHSVSGAHAFSGTTSHTTRRSTYFWDGVQARCYEGRVRGRAVARQRVCERPGVDQHGRRRGGVRGARVLAHILIVGVPTPCECVRTRVCIVCVYVSVYVIVVCVCMSHSRSHSHCWCLHPLQMRAYACVVCVHVWVHVLCSVPSVLRFCSSGTPWPCRGSCRGDQRFGLNHMSITPGLYVRLTSWPTTGEPRKARGKQVEPAAE